MHTSKLAGALTLSAFVLCACGGGGGDTVVPPAAAPTTFALNAGYKARIISGAAESFGLSGSCSGTATITTSAAVPSTFEGVAGYSSAQLSTIKFDTCLPANGSSSGTTYFNAGYMPIGLAIVGGEYSKFDVPPTDLPASVKVGDAGTFATLTTYADSTKAVVTGKRVLSYAIEADSATTAIANVITRSYDVSNQLLATQQSRYRMTQAGTLTLTLIDVQFSTTSTIHLVYTPR